MTLSSLLFYLIIVGVPIYLVVRFLRAYERRTQSQVSGSDVGARLELLEAQVERLGREFERVAEGQRFTNALLSGRDSRAAAVGEQTAAMRTERDERQSD